MLRTLLAVLCLLTIAAAYGWHYVTSYQPQQRSGTNKVSISLGDMNLGGVRLNALELEAKLNVTPQDYPTDLPSLLKQMPQALNVQAVHLPYEGGEAVLHDVEMKFSADEKAGKWQGNWTAKKLSWVKPPYPLPEMGGNGTFEINAQHAVISGNMQDAGQTHTIKFAANMNLQHTEKSSVRLLAGQLPFQGGMVKIENGTVFFAGSKRFDGVLLADNIKLSSLLDSFMEGKVSATGKVSGKLPLQVNSAGIAVIKGGVLSAGEGGSIKLSPDALPGGNEQLEMVRDILGNFNYTDLSVNLSSSEKEELTATLHVEGNNPDMYAGRPVKLNVHLSGDLLSLIRHSVIPLSDPKTLLKKGQNEKL